MSQKARVLQELRTAGKRGVRSDQFFSAHMPRGAARIKDLRDEGYEITSEREGKYVRYFLNVGISADGGCLGGSSSTAPDHRLPPDAAHAGGTASSTDSGVEPATPLPRSAPPERSVPNMFDADDCLKWGKA